MKFKKSVLILLLSAMLMLILQSAVYGAETAQFTVETNKTAVAGESFTVDISLDSNPGFAGLTLELSYDSTYLTLEGVEYSKVFDDLDAIVQMSSKTDAKPFKIQIASESNISYNGVILTATFSLSSKAKLGDYSISVSCGKDQMFDKDFKSISTKCVAGGVSLACTHNYEENVVPPKCDAKGYTEYRCTECHAYHQDNWTDEIPHSWRTVSSTKASCTEDGYTTRECRECEKTETVVSEKSRGHSFKVKSVVDSTCSEEGYTLHVCEECDYEYRDSYTPLADHTYEDEKITQQPSCTQVGYKKRTCIHCGDSYTEQIDKTDCDYRETARSEATHTAKGWTAYECAYCGATKKDGYVDPIPYDFEYQIITPATCTRDGRGKNICKDGCGHEEETVIQATGHTYGEWVTEVEATEEIQGLRSKVCTQCGDRVTESTPKLNKVLPPDENKENPLVEKWKGIPATTKAVLIIAAIAILSVVLISALFIKGMSAGVKNKKR